jgi:dTDP-4-dehydrorhamnose reductase
VFRVCLLGSTGFVGSAFARLFKSQGIEFAAVNIRNYQQYAGTQCDILINANGSSKKYLADEDPKLDFTLNVRSVVDSLHDFKYRLYVYLSSIDVYNNVSDPAQNHEEIVIQPEELSNYGFHKYLAELAVRKYATSPPAPLTSPFDKGRLRGILNNKSSPSWLIFRLGGMVGKGLKKNSIFDLLHGRPLRVHPDSAYQYLNTDDVARIVWQIASTPFKKQEQQTAHPELAEGPELIASPEATRREGPATPLILSLSKENDSMEKGQKGGEIFNLCGDGVITLRQVQEILGLPYEDNGLKKERYEVNVGKAKIIINVPWSQHTIKRFINS